MHKTLRFLFLFALFLVINGTAYATAPPNDSTCNAINLGPMPSPGACPNAPDGAIITFSGTTNNATFNPLDFSVTHCYTNASPDVWYRLRATGSYLYVSVTSSNGLNNFFVKLHRSQGSCLSLVPLDCITSTANALTYSFPTPVIGGEYYVQIGGSQPNEMGNFSVQMKSYNDCNGCVKQGSVRMIPAPVYGRYPMGDTVEMCATVDRWESLATSYLHGIVPVFGPDWDTNSIVVTLLPTGITNTNGWHWFTNVSTPSGHHSGFFFDGNNDGNPSNNPGDNGNVLSSWTGCWKIKSVVPCNTQDLTVDVHLYSDGETGSGNPLFVCNAYDAIHISTASQCCLPPHVVVNQPPGCATGNAFAVVNGANMSDVYNFSLVDTSMHAIQTYNNMMGAVTFSPLQPGQYYILANDVTLGNCLSFQLITIHPGMTLNMQQTYAGCTSGQGQAVVHVLNSTSTVFHYNWVGVPIANTHDSLAFNLPDGWVHVIVTDTLMGCMVEDSINIISQGMPDATFDLKNSPTCVNADTISLAGQPISPGGTFTLLSPTTAGITVNAATGMVYLNNTTYAPPFYIYVKYTVGTICQSTFVDSMQIVAVPPPPTATSATTWTYCIGSTPPTLTVIPPSNMYAVWYDLQTTGYTLGNSYQPPLNASTLPGTYMYGAATIFTFTGGCSSSPVVFYVSAVSPPSITTSNDTDICSGQNATLSVSGCSTCNFIWTPSPTIGSQYASVTQTSPVANTPYTVSATDQGSGCISFGSVNVWVNNCDTTIFSVYHGITPNGDGHNDTWIIEGLDSLMNVNVVIFNRWGQRVWEGNNYDNINIVWKGQDKSGHSLPDGTYFYIISNGKTHEKGWVELSH